MLPVGLAERSSVAYHRYLQRSAERHAESIHVNFDNGHKFSCKAETLEKLTSEAYSFRVKERTLATSHKMLSCDNGWIHWEYTFVRAIPQFVKSTVGGTVSAAFLYQTFDPTFGLICGAGYVGNILLHELGHIWGARMCGYETSCVIFAPYKQAYACVVIPDKTLIASPAKNMIIGMAGPFVGGLSAIAMGIVGLLIHPALVYVAMISCFNNLLNGIPMLDTQGSDGHSYRVAMEEQYENEKKRHLRPGLAILKYLFAACCATGLCALLLIFGALFYYVLLCSTVFAFLKRRELGTNLPMDVYIERWMIYLNILKKLQSFYDGYTGRYSEGKKEKMRD